MNTKKNLPIEETFAIAVKNHKENNFKVAEKLYKEVLKKNPDHFESVYYLGTLLAQTNQFNLAKSMLHKATQIKPDNAMAHNNLGNVLKNLEEYQEAIRSYEKAIKIQPDYAMAHNNLGIIFQELGENDKAINFFQMAIKYEPKNLTYIYNLIELDEKFLHPNLKKKIHEIIEKNNSTKKDIAYGNFLLSKYEHKNKKYKNEFNHLLKGHQYYFEWEEKKFKKKN